MTIGLWFYAALLVGTGVERLSELRISRRNAARAFALGGVEFGKRHFPVMVALHTGLLVACFAEAWLLHRPFVPALGIPALVVTLGCQGARYWIIGILGERWNTRVIVVPGLPLVARGPYRVLKHPNYVVVAIEGIALPLVYTDWITAIAFTVLNAILLLGVRIPVENRALAGASPS
jgi:methyltransferase